jgi:uncharacterized protein (TIGR00369 family)
MTDPWTEPVRGELFPGTRRGLSGIEQLRLMVNGQVAGPPIGELTGMRLTEVGVGTASFTMPTTGWLQVPQGMITGGVVAILADGPLGCAIHTALPAATGYTTTELSINMVRPAPSQGQLIARGRRSSTSSGEAPVTGVVGFDLGRGEIEGLAVEAFLVERADPSAGLGDRRRQPTGDDVPAVSVSVPAAAGRGCLAEPYSTRQEAGRSIPEGWVDCPASTSRRGTSERGNNGKATGCDRAGVRSARSIDHHRHQHSGSRRRRRSYAV